MISFFFTIFRFFKLLTKGIKEDADFRGLFFFILFLLFASVLFYTKIEGWGIVDSLYFSVMTMATVGYGDLTPTTDMDKIFTIFFTIFSVGAFVTFTAKFLQIILDNNKDRKLKIKNGISKMKKECKKQ